MAGNLKNFVRGLTFCAVALLVLAAPSSAATRTFPAVPSSLGVIPEDPGPCTASGPTRQVTFNVSGVVAPINNLAVRLTMSHPLVSDLSVALIAPGGAISQAIFYRVGTASDAMLGTVGSRRDLGGTYTFTDAAPTTPTWWDVADAQTGVAPSGTYRAATNGTGANALLLPLFSTVAPNGTWVVEIRDLCHDDQGTISAASLTMGPVKATKTGKRAAALKKCKKKKSAKKRKKCRRKARKLPA